jgi:hypothetical protein
MNKETSTQEESDNFLLPEAIASSYAQNMARSVDLSEAGKNFAALAEGALSGEEIVFSKDGVQVLKLVRLEESDNLAESPKKTYLPLGAWAHYDPDFDFDAWDALDEDVWKLFKNMP